MLKQPFRDLSLGRQLCYIPWQGGVLRSGGCKLKEGRISSIISGRASECCCSGLCPNWSTDRQYFSFYCACQGFLSLGGHRFPAKQCLRLHRFRSVQSSILSPVLGMASRRARQRLKGGGGGSGADGGPAAEKLRELLGSREAGTEPRPECVCGWRAWPAGGSGGSGGLRREPGSALTGGLLFAAGRDSAHRPGSALCRRSAYAVRLSYSCPMWERPSCLFPSAGPCILQRGSVMLQVRTYMSRLRAGIVSRASVGVIGRRVCLLYPSLTAVYCFLPPSGPPALEPISLLAGNL